MLFLQSSILSKPLSPLCGAVDIDHSFNLHAFSSFSLQNPTPPAPSTCLHFSDRIPKSLPCFAVSKKSDSIPDPEPSSNRKPKPKPKPKPKKDENPIPTTIPKKPRRGRRSEAAAVEDYIRDSLEKTFSSIREQNSGSFENKEKIMKEKVDDDDDDDTDDKIGNESSEDEDDEDEDEDENEGGKKMVVEEENPNWPLDTDVGWGIRASEYFEQHPIKNVVGEDGVEIDWEGETDEYWVKEINCLEWETFAFHPSPLIVFVFERYNRATDNWKVLKELEMAIKVYWNAKDRLPPRSVKIDINIERDLAYALKVKDCPQILFLRGNRILYREKEIRTADELVQMIAHFYYNAKRPSWIDSAALSPPY